MRSTASSSRPTTRWSPSTRRAVAGRTWPRPSVWKSTSVEQASRRWRGVDVNAPSRIIYTGGRRHALHHAVQESCAEVLQKITKGCQKTPGHTRSARARADRRYGFRKLARHIVDLAFAAHGRAATSRLRGRPHAARAAARGLLRRKPLADERFAPRAHRGRPGADRRRRAAPDGPGLLLGVALHARPRLHRLTLPL